MTEDDTFSVYYVARVTEAHTRPTEGRTSIFFKTIDGQEFALDFSPFALLELETKLNDARRIQVAAQGDH